MLHPATPAAEITLEIIIVVTVGATVLFSGVMLLLWRALSRRRERRRANAWVWLVGGGIAFPIAVLSALLAYATVRGVQLTAAPADGIVISVSGVRWWWDLSYRDPASGSEIRSANEIRVPVGRPVTLGLTTGDVIHSFWVPALGGKVDMMPGRVHQLRVQLTQPGVYRGACAEFCGDQHAKMALHVVAVAPDEFDRWLAAQAAPARPAEGALAQRGQQLFSELRCDACHAVRGIGGASQLGPDLTHVASRLYIGAGSLPTRGDNLREWVAHVQRIKPGALMPSFDHLDNEALTALAAFLDGLK